MLSVLKKKKKEKGIALCHKEQGFSANQRPVSLLMKSDLRPEEVTEDVIKALQQVTVTVSMEEFLSRFFGLWSYDAELLTKILGFQTESEARAEDPEYPEDRWEEQHRSMVESRVAQFNIMKAAAQGEEISLFDKYEILKVQQVFEKGVEENNIVFETDELNKKADVKAEAVVEPENKVEKTIVTLQDTLKDFVLNTLGQGTNNPQKETEVSEIVDVTKSAEYIDLQKQLEKMKAQIDAAEAIVKANEEMEKQTLVAKASAIPFISDEDKSGVAELLIKSKADNTLDGILSLVEKATGKITELEKALADKDAEIVELKKSFGETEHGKDVKVQTTDLSPQEVIKQRAAQLKAELEKNK